MTDALVKIVKNFVLFCQNVVGSVNSPYATFRRISQQQEVDQVAFIFIFVALYFAFGTSVRMGIGNPYLLTLEFNKLFAFAVLSYFLFGFFIYKIGTFLGGRGNLKSVLLSWSYTLLPTIIWFLVTSLIYIFFPPPRTVSLPGKLLSIVFIAFSIAMLYWKIILYYLTLRFSLRLDLMKIIVISGIIMPVLGIYGVLMYKLEIFRIPFI